MNLQLSDLYKELDRGDGICRYFDLTARLCLIYENRPIICNIDEYYEQNLKNIIMKEEYYILNYAACEKLKKI